MSTRKVVPGTESAHEAIERINYLLDFIDKQPVMQALLDRVYRQTKGEEISSYLVDTDQLQPWVYLIVDQRPEGNVCVALLSYQLFNGWLLDEEDKKMVNFGEVLDIEKITKALGLSNHDIAELMREYWEQKDQPVVGQV